MGPRAEQFRIWFFSHFVTLLLLLAIAVGTVLAAVLILFARHREYNTRNVMYTGVLGELLTRGLECMSLPLAVAGITLSVVRLRRILTLQLIVYTMLYMLVCKCFAIVLAVTLSAFIIPEYYSMDVYNRTQVKVMELTKDITSIDNFLDCIRNLFPANVIAMTFKHYKTVLIPKNTTVNSMMWPVHRDGTYEYGTNYFGVVNYSIIFGITLIHLNYKPHHVSILFDTLFSIVKKVTGWLLCVSPIFAISIIAGAAMAAEDDGYVYSHFGKMLFVVILGQAIQCLVVYPLIFYSLCFANPYGAWKDCSDAVLIGFISGSSWVTLPITMHNLETRTDLSPALIRFVLPITHIFNKDGTTLFVTASLLAAFRMENLTVHLGMLVSLSTLGGLTGCAGGHLPYSNVLCILMGVRSFDVTFDQVPSFMAVDWLVKRTGTVADIIGDVYLLHIFAAYSSSDLMKSRLRAESSLVF